MPDQAHKPAANIDPLLLPLLGAEGEAEALLSMLVFETADPIIHGILRQKLHVSLEPSDGRVQNHVDACVSYAVHWEVLRRLTGAREITNGVDYVSAVVEHDAWRLCHSSFIGSPGYPSLGLR